MTKPTFNANYPIAASLVSSDNSYVRRFNNCVPKIIEAIDFGYLTKAEFADIKTDINRYVECLFASLSYVYRESTRDLNFWESIYEARLLSSYKKKLIAFNSHNHFIIESIALVDELSELQTVLEYLKSIHITSKEKADKTKSEIKNVLLTDKVYLAVLPLKVASEERAEKSTRQNIFEHLEVLKTVGNDLDKYAPHGMPPTAPRYSYEWDAQRIQENAANGLRSYILSFTNRVDVYSNTPNVVAADLDHIEVLVQRAIRDAGLAFEAYVHKLNAKIGDKVLEATLTGSPWHDSLLTVQTENKGTQYWNTKTIVNCSKLGKLFNQYPTRLAK